MVATLRVFFSIYFIVSEWFFYWQWRIGGNSTGLGSSSLSIGVTSTFHAITEK